MAGSTAKIPVQKSIRRRQVSPSCRERTRRQETVLLQGNNLEYQTMGVWHLVWEGVRPTMHAEVTELLSNDVIRI